MNKRIKQLADEAGGEFYDGFAGSTNFVKFAEDDFKKFAQLIVAEVLAVQEKFIANGHNAWHLNKPTREHFGVEE